ncbi:MAG: hypothetical protein ACJ78Q_03900 [Chloroflexia bacterium]
MSRESLDINDKAFALGNRALRFLALPFVLLYVGTGAGLLLYLLGWRILESDSRYAGDDTDQFVMLMFGLLAGVLFMIGIVGGLVRVRLRGGMGSVALPAPNVRFSWRALFRLLTLVLIMVAPLGAMAYQRGPTTSNPSSWADQFAVAEAKARSIDKGVVLESVRAQPLYDRTPPLSAETTLEEEFEFRKPNNHHIVITLLDTDPPRIKEVRDESSVSSPWLSEEVQKARDIAQGMRLSPRDILKEVLADPASPRPIYRDYLRISLWTDYTSSEYPHGCWVVTYPPQKISDPLNESYSDEYIYLDPVNGRVVERKLGR